MAPSLNRLLKLAGRNPKSSQSALKASAAPPSSGFTFIDNSQGASAAVAELSSALGDISDIFNLDEELEPQLQLLTTQLDNEGSQYSNSQVKDEQCQTWSCTQQKARLIAIAWNCADHSYSKTFNDPAQATRVFENCLLTQDCVTAPTSDGTVKTVVFTTVSPKDSSSDVGPILVIAIRGSASKVDHMVNSNGDPRDDPSRFLESGSKRSIQAHSGFLGCTAALDSIVSRRIQKYKQSGAGSQVLFTGHSAGGAVASLLFLRSLSTSTDDSPCFSCITFGAPPTVSPPVNLDHISSSGGGVCLNIINEFDPVTRADKPYILSLVNLIKRMYHQPPISDPSIDAQAPSLTIDSEPGDTSWPLPRAVLFHVGPRILLRKRLVGDEIELQAAEISQSEFEKLLFCGAAVHKRVDYGARVDALVNGRFNGAERWG
ncbi:hypothetical protein MYU51_016163 [Penicillium brevicompactum]